MTGLDPKFTEALLLGLRKAAEEYHVKLNGTSDPVTVAYYGAVSTALSCVVTTIRDALKAATQDTTSPEEEETNAQDS